MLLSRGKGQESSFHSLGVKSDVSGFHEGSGIYYQNWLKYFLK